MAICAGRVNETRLSIGGMEALIGCPPGTVPAAGRYLHAWAPVEIDAPLGRPLFLSQPAPEGFWAAAPLPANWVPGTELVLRGPLGRGFDLPPAVSRLALAAFGESPARLLPLALQALSRECSVTLFTDTALPSLPTSLEIYPLLSLRESLSWPDLLAIDLPLAHLSELRGALGLESDQPLSCQAQALIWTPMPCAGIGECGACAAPARRGYKLACVDGPVFPLTTLDW